MQLLLVLLLVALASLHFLHSFWRELKAAGRPGSRACGGCASGGCPVAPPSHR